MMATTTTSSPSTELREAPLNDIQFTAFADELTKIAESNHPKLKRWLKNTAILAGAAGASVGAGMLIERGAQKFLAQRWASLTPAARSNIKNGLAGVAGMGVAMAGDSVFRERLKRSTDEKVSRNP